MHPANAEAFKWANITAWHNAGYDGTGVTAATYEDTTTTHGKGTAEVFGQVAPGARILSRERPLIEVSGNDLVPDSKAALTSFFHELLAEGVNIVTYSVGHGGGYSEALARLDREVLIASGVTMFASAGNDGDEIDDPSAAAYHEHYLAVGAAWLYKGQVRREGYSNTGPRLDLLALTNIRWSNGVTFTGTSCAAPCAAAILALIQQAAQRQLGRFLTPAEARAVLLSFCQDMGPPGFDEESGQGVLRLPAEVPDFRALLSRLGVVSVSKTFSDIKGHWAEAEILEAAARGDVLGYPDGTVKPDERPTRAENIALANRVNRRLEAEIAALRAEIRAFKT